MGGVINLIKNLFGGIFSFIGGIFGGKKSGYYMELDEAKSVIAKPAEAVKKAAAPVAAAIAEVTKSEPEKTEAPKAESAKAEAPKAKPEKAKAKKATAEPATADLNGSPNGAKPPVPANTLNLPQPTVSFASDYLVPKPTNSRRRPGANMGSFLEMAKTVKTPNN